MLAIFSLFLQFRWRVSNPLQSIDYFPPQNAAWPVVSPAVCFSLQIPASAVSHIPSPYSFPYNAPLVHPLSLLVCSDYIPNRSDLKCLFTTLCVFGTNYPTRGYLNRHWIFAHVWHFCTSSSYCQLLCLQESSLYPIKFSLIPLSLSPLNAHHNRWFLWNKRDCTCENPEELQVWMPKCRQLLPPLQMLLVPLSFATTLFVAPSFHYTFQAILMLKINTWQKKCLYSLYYINFHGSYNPMFQT